MMRPEYTGNERKFRSDNTLAKEEELRELEVPIKKLKK